MSPAGRGGGPPSACSLLPRGSALANTVSQFTLALLLFLYILAKRLHQDTWGGKGCLSAAWTRLLSRLEPRPGGRLCRHQPRLCLPTGWSRECLQDWGPFFRLAVPSMLMLCVEWWAYEIGSFLSGQHGAGRGAWGAARACGKHAVTRPSPTGVLGMVELGAQSIAYELAVIVYMVSAQACPGVGLCASLQSVLSTGIQHVQVVK